MINPPWVILSNSIRNVSVYSMEITALEKILKAHAFIAGFGLPLPVFALTGLMLLKPEPMIVVLIRTAPEVG